ncbi:MAG: hypothetical protein AB1489_39755 [Acidobacteriota bacterium]
MADRKRTPNIMAELLEGKSNDNNFTGTTVSQQTGKGEDKPLESDSISLELQASESEEQLNQESNTKKQKKIKTAITSKPEKPNVGKTVHQYEGAEKAKATYYLSQNVLDELDEAWFRIRKMAKPEDRGKLSKSLLVELALQMAIQDLDKKDSHFAALFWE